MTVDAAYRDCRRIAARHGHTYYLATRLLPLQRRPGIHALYAFARQVDDVVDVATGKRPWVDVAADLDRVQARLEHPAAGAGLAPSWDAVFVALRDTIARYDIPLDYFRAFLDSMRMDVPGTELYRNRYPTMADLRRYTYGSAAVIGLQVLPILGTIVPLDEARAPAAALGEAFQLTNFLRDVGEDLDRDRIYLPADELAVFGVTEDLLRDGRRRGVTDRRVRAALAHLVAVNRSIYRDAARGIPMLEPRVRPGIAAAHRLYGGILDEIAACGYDILGRRVVVPRRRRAVVAAGALVQGAAVAVARG